jgi:hypothetical protein
LKRAGILMLVSIAAHVLILAGQSLSARIDRDQLRVLSPRLHFLIGEPLTRLRNGATVNYEFQLVLRTDRNSRPVARAQQRFAVSYDLWEEKFAVTRLDTAPRSVSHLSAAAAEAWCVDNVSVPVAALAPEQPFWLRLDFRTEDPSDSINHSENTGMTLSGLIDIFSRRSRGEQLRGFDEAGPLRLSDLRKKTAGTK